MRDAIIWAALVVVAAGCAVPRSETQLVGPYALLGAGFTKEDFDGGSGLDDGAHGAARVGYRLAPHVGADLELQYHGGIDSGVVETSFSQATANIRGHLPVEGPLSPFAFVGAGVVRADFDRDSAVGRDSSETDLLLRAGVGAIIDIDPQWFLSIEAAYNMPQDDIDHLDYGAVTVGFGFRFGGASEPTSRKSRKTDKLPSAPRGRYRVNN